MPLVKIPRAMRKFMVLPSEVVSVEGFLLKDCLNHLVDLHPGLKPYIGSFDFVNVYIDNENARFLSPDKKVNEYALIEIVSAMAGG